MRKTNTAVLTKLCDALTKLCDIEVRGICAFCSTEISRPARRTMSVSQETGVRGLILNTAQFSAISSRSFIGFANASFSVTPDRTGTWWQERKKTCGCFMLVCCCFMQLQQYFSYIMAVRCEGESPSLYFYRLKGSLAFHTIYREGNSYCYIHYSGMKVISGKNAEIKLGLLYRPILI